MPFTAQRERSLFDTSDAFDAGTVGHDGPISPSEGGFSISMSVDPKSGCWFRLNGPDGEINLCSAEAALLADTITVAMKKAATQRGRNVEAVLAGRRLEVA